MRLALRRARDAIGLSQGAVADRMGWSLSKVQRIEAGDNAISGTDLRALLDLYGVTDPEEIEQLQEEARVSRRQRWWTKPEYREYLTTPMLQLVQFEAEAAEIRLYSPMLVPGSFQTSEYAEHVLGIFSAVFDDEKRRVRRDVRIRRREAVLESTDSTRHYIILDESVIQREVGGLAVMADQLDLLADLARRPNVFVRIISLGEGAVLGSAGYFSIVDIADEFEDAMLYREFYTEDSFSHDPKDVAFHREMFEDAWSRSLNEEKSIRAIAAAATALRARLDRA
ncbi:helix-turn-helix domain-containing protein [Actinoplanes sp. KI2]|uniref:helix-turn-helix domain-containing protein n=1 Tax=Actinoplanes sp. KI2 TaxID=2983315 RepID=UPI0021D573A8|nr:helix-turn-helix transcriptional regulator [Actinoplanes sp. KI2]MCU7728784.1 helix-turn-helix domain-containing protein [Actinoplanes sp. KI2]